MLMGVCETRLNCIFDFTPYTTGAQNWHIVSLLGDVTSPTTVAHHVIMTCSDNRGALTAASTAHSVQKQAFRVHH